MSGQISTRVGDVKVIDKFPSFSRNVATVMDQGLGELAKDILLAARPRTPYSGTVQMRSKAGRAVRRGSGGHLRAHSYPDRIGLLNWQVVYNKEYALAQERGYSDSGAVYRNYTTPGTGKGYLKTSGDEQRAKALAILKRNAQRARP